MSCSEMRSADMVKFARKHGGRYRVIMGDWRVDYLAQLRHGARGLIPAPNFVPEQSTLYGLPPRVTGVRLPAISAASCRSYRSPGESPVSGRMFSLDDRIVACEPGTIPLPTADRIRNRCPGQSRITRESGRSAMAGRREAGGRTRKDHSTDRERWRNMMPRTWAAPQDASQERCRALPCAWRIADGSFPARNGRCMFAETPSIYRE